MFSALIAALTVLLLTPAQAPPARPVGKITLTPIRVTESRVKYLDGQEPGFGDRDELNVLVRVEGEQVAHASSYGHLKLTEAVDDTGADLKPKEKKSFFSAREEGFESLRSGRLGMLQEEDEPGFRVELEMAPAARKAAKIKVLRGEFQVLAGGKEVKVTASKLPGMIGKSIEDPQLKAAGVEIRVLDPKKARGGLFGLGGGGGDGKSLPLELKGKIAAVQKIEILDEDGETATQGHMSSGSDEQQNRTYDLKRPLDDKMKLQIDLIIGQKTVKVPFDLKDIPLP